MSVHAFLKGHKFLIAVVSLIGSIAGTVFSAIDVKTTWPKKK